MKKKNKFKLYFGIFCVLAFFGWVMQLLGLSPETETPTVLSVTEEKTTKTESTQQTTTESTEEPTETVNYDIGEMNVKITDSFNESVQFNQDGADGYEWTVYISEIKLNDNGAIHTTVTDDFLLLDETQKTEVLNHVNTSVNMVVFIETSEDKSYFITAYDSNGNKVAQSKVTKVTEYTFY